jgi:hypothetical protein
MYERYWKICKNDTSRSYGCKFAIKELGLVEPTIGSNLLESLCPNITAINVPSWYAGDINQIILDVHYEGFYSHLESIPEEGNTGLGKSIQSRQELHHKFHQNYLEFTFELRKTLRAF